MAEMMRTIAVWTLILLAGAASARAGGSHFHSTTPGHKVDYRGFFDAAVDLSDSPTGQAVLAECLAAYGGVEKLRTLQGFRIRYDESSLVGGETTELVKSFQRGRRYRTVQGTDSRLINGLTCWYEHGDQTAELDGTHYRAELFSYLTLAMPLAAETEHFDQIRYGRREGDPLEYLYFDKADSVLVVLGISAEDHLIVSSTGVLPQGEKEFVFSNEFSGHTEYEGFVFPGVVNFYSLGMRVGQAEVREVEINPAFGADEFQPRGQGK